MHTFPYLASNKFQAAHNSSGEAYESPHQRAELLIVLGIISLVVALLAAMQIFRILINRHRISFQTLFLVLCGITAVLRGVFLICVAVGSLSSLLAFITNEFPLVLQLATFSLLVVFFAGSIPHQFYSKHNMLFRARKHARIMWLFATLGILVAQCAMFEVVCHRKMQCVNEAKSWNLLYGIVYVVLCLCLALFGTILACQLNLHPHLVAPELQTRSFWQVMCVVLCLVVCFGSRGLYNICVVAGVPRITEDTFELTSFLLLLAWDILPTMVVLMFFFHIPKSQRIRLSIKFLSDVTPPLLLAGDTSSTQQQPSPLSSPSQSTFPHDASALDPLHNTTANLSQLLTTTAPTPTPNTTTTASASATTATMANSSKTTTISPSFSSTKANTPNFNPHNSNATTTTPNFVAESSASQHTNTLLDEDVANVLRALEHSYGNIEIGDGIAVSWQDEATTDTTFLAEIGQQQQHHQHQQQHHHHRHHQHHHEVNFSSTQQQGMGVMNQSATSPSTMASATRPTTTRWTSHSAHMAPHAQLHQTRSNPHSNSFLSFLQQQQQQQQLQPNQHQNQNQNQKRRHYSNNESSTGGDSQN